MITVKEMQEITKRALENIDRANETKKKDIREKVERAMKTAATKGEYTVTVVLQEDEIGCWNTLTKEYWEFKPQRSSQRVTLTWGP